ncbi:MAG: helix-turn-helix domain-containing protein [Candidatus Competibacteraceae bacterium]
MSVEKSLAIPPSIAASDNLAIVMQGVFKNMDEKNGDHSISGFWEGIRFTRLTNERYESRFAGISLPDLLFGAEYTQGTIRMQGVIAKDTLSLAFTSGKLSVMGSRSQPALNIFGPGTAVDATQRGESSFHSVLLRGSMLTRLLAGNEGELIARRWLAPRLHRPFVADVEAGWLYQLLHDLAGVITTVPAALLKPGSLRLARDDVLAATHAILVAAEPGMTTAPIATAFRRRALALAAEELIWSQPNQVISLAGICQSLNTSVRTLQLAFQEQFGVTFKTFLRAVRLHQAHTAILRAGHRHTLATIAIEHGFWHLGRFTHYYRQLFGCAPSTTRRRIWGNKETELSEMAG